MTTKTQNPKPKSDNPDPITGEPGAHPVGTGVGAAVGAGVGGAALGAGAAAAAGAMAAGATMGSVAGPLGTVVGAVAGGVAGAMAGKSIAESIDPTAEDAYWRKEHRNRPYYQQGTQYEEYQPAYKYGWESRAKYHDRSFDEVEPNLERDWLRTNPGVQWSKAKHPVRDAWDRIDRPQNR